MKLSFNDSWDVAEFVDAKLRHLERGSALTMTITREKSEAYCATIVIEELSADYEEAQMLMAQVFSQTQVNT